MEDLSFNLKQLKIIQRIKTEVNINLTAKKLYLSQSSLIAQIKNLEQNTYSKILIRKKNQLYLTNEGELILDYAKKILALCTETDKAILYLKKIKKFSLKIGSTKTIGKSFSLKLIDLFCKRYYYTNIQLQIYFTEKISWDILNGRIDMGIVFHDEVPKNLYSHFYMTPYFQEKMVLLLPKSPKWATNINKFNLDKLNFITLKHYFPERKLMEKIAKRLNINLKELKIKLELNSIEAIKRSVKHGLGVAFLSTTVIKDELYSKFFHSVSIEDIINTNKQFTIIVNMKNNVSYLSGQFYNYCFMIAKTNLYNKFINLDY
uniref:Probable RuBisCO transcriptional regulator n=1 Tax=Pleurocladia lacustris TaxID=246121 RepID=A0A1I9LVC7_9PHAE|nr:lysR transcriptional regulator [Pleurocladia lacustris]ANS57547.1 lysR transcriptional regulator [Pleurocladia lacustris]ANS57691.1 lysR transcriptional regulator [Pleurocladia lacustris]